MNTERTFLQQSGVVRRLIDQAGIDPVISCSMSGTHITIHAGTPANEQKLLKTSEVIPTCLKLWSQSHAFDAWDIQVEKQRVTIIGTQIGDM